MEANLMEAFEKAMERAARFTEAFPWTHEEAYGLWLAQTYYFVRHSSRLLALGAAKAPFEREALHKRMLEHLREELGHDKVAEMDMKRLGFDLEKAPEFAVTRAFYQNQYFTLQNRSAAAFLGWILFLEGFAAKQGPRVHEIVEKAFGAKCTHFVRMHTEEDQEHIAKALEAAMSLSPEEKAEIIENMEQSVDLYETILTEIKAEVVARKSDAVRELRQRGTFVSSAANGFDS